MLATILEKLDEILSLVRRIATSLQVLREENMSALDDLAAQVSANTEVESSALTLIQGIAAQLAAAKTDPAKLAALQQQLQASATALAAAVAANTAPPAPAPAPAPAPPPAPTP